MILIELLVLFTTFFPIYHLLVALSKEKKRQYKIKKEHSFTILIPCYNESVCISKTIDALKKLEYCNFEVIFINDGSKDNTFQIIYNKLSLSPLSKFFPITKLSLSHVKKYLPINLYRSQTYGNFYCIDKPNTGKALSLNEGIKISKNEIIVTLDADSILNPDCLTRLNKAFADENIVAAGGAIHIMQAKDTKYIKKLSIFKRLLIKIQSIDYLKGFFIYKLSLARQDAMAIISGAFGAFRKSVLYKVGGYRKSLGEDIDITIKIQRYIQNTNKRIAYLPNAVCYTECPESVSDLYRQRIRWQKGFIDCIVYHSKFLLSTCIKCPVSFFLIFESIIIGLFSCILPLHLVASFITTVEILRIINIYIVFIIINIVYSGCAYIISKRYSFPYKKKFILSIITDILLLKPFLGFIYVIGTIGYLVNKGNWKKTKRSVMLAKTKEVL